LERVAGRLTSALQWVAMATHGNFGLVGALGLALFGCWATSSCNLADGYVDFGKDLTNPELVVIDGPGQKIADGQLSGMLVDPWGDSGAVVVGFRYMDDGPYLRMQPFDGSAGCNVGRAFRCIVFNRLPNEPQYIAYLDDLSQNGQRGTLNFTDHECNVVYGGLKDAELPTRLFESPPGFVVAVGSQLLEVDPFRKKKRVIADNLTYWPGAPSAESQMPIWFVADGQLVVLDGARQEALRLGTNVTEVVFEQTDPNRGLYLVDGGNLTHYVEATGAEPKTIATDVCSAHLISVGIAYRAPCGDGRLIVADPEKGTKYDLGLGIAQLYYAQLRSRSDGSGADLEAVYAMPSSTAGYNDLWLKQAGQEPRLWKQRLGRFISATTGPKPTLLAIVDSDGSTGTLIRVDADGEHTLYPGVVLGYAVESVADGWMVMIDVVNEFGTLVWFNEQGETKVVAERVWLNEHVQIPTKEKELTGVTDDRYYNLRAFRTQAESGTGPITLLDRTNLFAPHSIGKVVADERYAFFRNMTALAYLEAIDNATGTGTLNVYQTRIGANSVVSKSVNEFAELLWPYQGVIYSVKQGDQYSLWAARAKP